MNKSIFITGGSGFIGKNLTEQLSGKFDIFSPTHKELELLNAPAVRKFITKNKIDVIINAANVGVNRGEVVENLVRKNSQIFFNVARNVGLVEKIIHLGSGAEYDKRRPLIKVKEKDFDQFVPDDDYGFAKYLFSKFIITSNLPIICLRPFGIFGKYENQKIRFISSAIVKNLSGLPIVIHQNTLFDYLFIDDLVKIINFFIVNSITRGIFNVTPTQSVDLATLAKKINLLSDRPSKIIIEKKGLANEYTGDNKKLLKLIPKLSFTSLSDSLDKLYKYYKTV